MAISCHTKCRDKVSCAKWALARSDRAVFRQVTKITTVAMGACHEPDVPAPDAVPNAVPHACRYCVTDLRDPPGPPGLKGRHPSGKGCRSDERSNRRCCEGQTQTGGNPARAGPPAAPGAF